MQIFRGTRWWKLGKKLWNYSNRGDKMVEQSQEELICLRIIGKESLNFEDIEAKLPIKPNSKNRKNDRHINIVGKETKYIIKADSIIYNIRVEKGEEPCDAIRRSLNSFLPYKNYLKSLKETCYTCFRISITSDYAQIYYELPPDIVELISELGLEIEISIFSMGGVIDDNGC